MYVLSKQHLSSQDVHFNVSYWRNKKLNPMFAFHFSRYTFEWAQMSLDEFEIKVFD